jgi:hypothetical protein
MLAAGVMLAHLWAAKAVRGAVFLGAWDASDLPAMALATSLLVVVAVPFYMRLLGRFGPRTVVPAGFLLSAAGHIVEWRLSSSGPWVAVLIYLHVSGLGALLLSGFWSLASEIFDTQTAKTSFGRIAAAGTLGGLAGTVAIERVGAAYSLDATLLLLAGLHLASATGAAAVGRSAGRTLTPAASQGTMLFEINIFKTSPHFRTIAFLVGMSTAAAFVVEYLFQASAEATIGQGPELLRFFALFYLVVGVATALVQLASGASVRQLGLGTTISMLPMGVFATSGLALAFPTFPALVILARGVESMLRGSLFRSGYELLFVPMDAEEKRRTKAFLDVTCDRAGDAVGAGLVQAALLFAAAMTGLSAATPQLASEIAPVVTPALLAMVLGLSAAAIWLSRRLNRLYLGVVERQLSRRAELTPVAFPSEAGWSVISLQRTPVAGLSGGGAAPARSAAVKPGRTREEDPRLASLAELRSGDRARVERALDKLSRPSRLQIAQVVTLLAWDELAPRARTVLEAHAARHVGLLIDALVDPDSDFAVRRRLPRILSGVGVERALEGLVWGLDDARFEVRYQCGRAIDRILRRRERLPVDASQVLRAIERELSVPPDVWHGHRLIDRPEGDDEAAAETGGAVASRNLEHVFTLLGTIWPREAVQVAHRGIQSDDPHLRGLAVEYIDGVLPPAIRERLWLLVRSEP